MKLAKYTMADTETS